MRYFFSILGIILSLVLLKYREKVGELIGEADWMNKIGGVYMFVVIIAGIVFLWSISTLTNTTDIFFLPIIWLLPGARNAGSQVDTF